MALERRFPNPKTDPERYAAWVAAVPAGTHKGYVCSKHFSQDVMTRPPRRRLHRGAVPSIFEESSIRFLQESSAAERDLIDRSLPTNIHLSTISELRSLVAKSAAHVTDTKDEHSKEDTTSFSVSSCVNRVHEEELPVAMESDLTPSVSSHEDEVEKSNLSLDDVSQESHQQDEADQSNLSLDDVSQESEQQDAARNMVNDLMEKMDAAEHSGKGDDHDHSGKGDDHDHSGKGDDHDHSGKGDDHGHSGKGDDELGGKGGDDDLGGKGGDADLGGKGGDDDLGGKGGDNFDLRIDPIDEEEGLKSEKKRKNDDNLEDDLPVFNVGVAPVSSTNVESDRVQESDRVTVLPTVKEPPGDTESVAEVSSQEKNDSENNNNKQVEDVEKSNQLKNSSDTESGVEDECMDTGEEKAQDKEKEESETFKVESVTRIEQDEDTTSATEEAGETNSTQDDLVSDKDVSGADSSLNRNQTSELKQSVAPEDGPEASTDQASSSNQAKSTDSTISIDEDTATGDTTSASIIQKSDIKIEVYEPIEDTSIRSGDGTTLSSPTHDDHTYRRSDAVSGDNLRILSVWSHQNPDVECSVMNPFPLGEPRVCLEDLSPLSIREQRKRKNDEERVLTGPPAVKKRAVLPRILSSRSLRELRAVLSSDTDTFSSPGGPRAGGGGGGRDIQGFALRLQPISVATPTAVSPPRSVAVASPSHTTTTAVLSEHLKPDLLPTVPQASVFCVQTPSALGQNVTLDLSKAVVVQEGSNRIQPRVAGELKRGFLSRGTRRQSFYGFLYRDQASDKLLFIPDNYDKAMHETVSSNVATSAGSKSTNAGTPRSYRKYGDVTKSIVDKAASSRATTRHSQNQASSYPVELISGPLKVSRSTQVTKSKTHTRGTSPTPPNAKASASSTSSFSSATKKKAGQPMSDKDLQSVRAQISQQAITFLAQPENKRTRLVAVKEPENDGSASFMFYVKVIDRMEKVDMGTQTLGDKLVEKRIQRLEQAFISQAVRFKLMSKAHSKENQKYSPIKHLLGKLAVIQERADAGEMIAEYIIDQVKNYKMYDEKKEHGTQWSIGSHKLAYHIYSLDASLFEWVRKKKLLMLPTKQRVLSKMDQLFAFNEKVCDEEERLQQVREGETDAAVRGLDATAGHGSSSSQINDDVQEIPIEYFDDSQVSVVSREDGSFHYEVVT